MLNLPGAGSAPPDSNALVEDPEMRVSLRGWSGWSRRERTRWSREPLFRIFLSVALAVGLQVGALGNPERAAAHCVAGGVASAWATGSATFNGNFGVQGTIQPGNPAICAHVNGTGFSAEWVTSCDLQCSLGRDGWIQTGWIKRVGYAAPKGFCELAASFGGSGFGSPPLLVEFALTAVNHVHEGSYASSTWTCRLDGVSKTSKPFSWMGFSAGDIVIDGGETDSFHTTIGVMAPAKLQLTSLKVKFTAWGLISFAAGSPVFPYGLDAPAAGQLRNWTVAH